MKSLQTVTCTDPDALSEAILSRVGLRIRLGMPPGAGKANRVANALFKRAAADQRLSLEIFTALSLEIPEGNSELERRFVGPLADRLFTGYEELSYTRALRENNLPPNVKVSEFYFTPGAWIGSLEAQRNYVSANYTDACRVIRERGINVVAQLVAPDIKGQRCSLSCNPDLTLDLLPDFERRRASGKSVATVAEINRSLPYMRGPAEVDVETFDFVLDASDGGYRLFGTPKQPATPEDHAIGLQAASLVSDGGTLQIGIGAHADALVHALLLRQRSPEVFAEMLSALGTDPATRETARLERGLYGLTELFVDGFLDLYRAGVLKRRVHDDPEVMRAADAGAPEAVALVESEGVLLHGAFFLGPESMYRNLREMSDAERDLFRMMPISFTNRLLGGEDLKRLQRRDARFLNSALMATLLGASASDALEDGQVVSGVGGQQEFQLQARELAGARAVLMLNATRQHRGRRTSNILWSYGHTTIPRHLRDVFVTEYGVAETANLTDEETIAAMLSIADAEFHDGLLRDVRRAGKVGREFQLPAAASRNTHGFVAGALAPFAEEGLLPAFPLESGLTEEEEVLAVALTRMSHSSPIRALMGGVRTILFGRAADRQESTLLTRMGLASPIGLKERSMAGLVLYALRQ